MRHMLLESKRKNILGQGGELELRKDGRRRTKRGWVEASGIEAERVFTCSFSNTVTQMKHSLGKS